MIKSFFKKTLASLVKNDAMWSFLNAVLVRPAEFAKREREAFKSGFREPTIDFNEMVKSIAPDLTVRHGPFRGMKYPQGDAAGSVIVPKMLGSYERELHEVIEKICQSDYSEVVDIGCAEGYYAIGLARRMPNCRVYAFDSDGRAIELCQKMAEVNQVASRLVTGSWCDGSKLQALPFTRKALIFCDCEGYEKELFTEEVIKHLKHHDVLVEVHDCNDIETSVVLRRRFAETHTITVIESIDDIKKAHTYDYPELEKYDLATRRKLVGEYRASIMEWFFMTPKFD